MNNRKKKISLMSVFYLKQYSRSSIIHTVFILIILCILTYFSIMGYTGGDSPLSLVNLHLRNISILLLICFLTYYMVRLLLIYLMLRQNKLKSILLKRNLIDLLKQDTFYLKDVYNDHYLYGNKSKNIIREDIYKYLILKYKYDYDNRILKLFIEPDIEYNIFEKIYFGIINFIRYNKKEIQPFNDEYLFNCSKDIDNYKASIINIFKKNNVDINTKYYNNNKSLKQIEIIVNDYKVNKKD